MSHRQGLKCHNNVILRTTAIYFAKETRVDIINTITKAVVICNKYLKVKNKEIDNSRCFSIITKADDLNTSSAQGPYATFNQRHAYKINQDQLWRLNTKHNVRERHYRRLFHCFVFDNCSFVCKASLKDSWPSSHGQHACKRKKMKTKKLLCHTCIGVHSNLWNSTV